MKIRVTTGSLAGKSYLLRDGVVVIGRSHDCHVRIPKESSSVSKRHLLLVLSPDGVSLTNNSSHSDTTFVDGASIPPGHKISIVDGNVVRIGRKGSDVEFQIEDDEGATSSGLEFGTRGGRPTETLGGTIATGQATRGGMTQLTNGGTVGTVMPGFQPTGLPTVGTRLPENFQQRPFKTVSSQGTVTVHEQGEGAPTDHGNDEKTLPPGGTIKVDPDEIKALIDEAILSRKRRAVFRFAVVVGVFILSAMTYYLLRPRPESELTWPTRSDGSYAVCRRAIPIPLANEGEEGGFSIGVPEDPRMAEYVSSNDVSTTQRVQSYIGAARDVPLFIEAYCFRDSKAVNKTTKQRFDVYVRGLESTGAWNFLAVRPVDFIGLDNGLPYFDAKYLRTIQSKTSSEQRYGHLMFAVYGDLTIVITREIPAIEQWRGSALLARERLLRVERAVLEVRWEGRPDFRDSSIDDLLAEVDGYLLRKTPQLWKEVEFLLQSAMIKSVLEKSDSSRIRTRLRKLRENERDEYCRLHSTWETFQRLGDKASCDSTISDALKVFSEADRRSWFLMKGEWR